MNILLAVIIAGLCFLGMGIGLIVAQKCRTKNCSVSPEECACQNDGTDPLASKS